MPQSASARKLHPPGELAARVAKRPRLRVLTNGRPGILRRGHVTTGHP